MAKDWSESEVDLIINDYFSMLYDELTGTIVSKSRHRRSLLPLLNNRSEASIEFKYSNISAVLAILNMPFISGYKPLNNFQNILLSKITDYTQKNNKLNSAFETFANWVPKPTYNVDYKTFEVSPPILNNKESKNSVAIRKPIKKNYLEEEQNNRKLGLMGEELVLDYERYSLLTAGCVDLADKIEWVSKEWGDGLGFDILSKNFDGTDKYIEVKTTKLGKETPFFFSKNELEFANENSTSFHFYRVFNLQNDPKIFCLQGRYDDFCRREAVKYKGIF